MPRRPRTEQDYRLKSIDRLEPYLVLLVGNDELFS